MREVGRASAAALGQRPTAARCALRPRRRAGRRRGRASGVPRRETGRRRPRHGGPAGRPRSACRTSWRSAARRLWTSPLAVASTGGCSHAAWHSPHLFDRPVTSISSAEPGKSLRPRWPSRARASSGSRPGRAPRRPRTSAAECPLPGPFSSMRAIDRRPPRAPRRPAPAARPRRAVRVQHQPRPRGQAAPRVAAHPAAEHLGPLPVAVLDRDFLLQARLRPGTGLRRALLHGRRRRTGARPPRGRPRAPAAAASEPPRAGSARRSTHTPLPEDRPPPRTPG